MPLKYDTHRNELIDFIPNHTKRLLDIGCSTGRYATEVSRQRPEIELWGVEPDDESFSVAEPAFHRCLSGMFPDVENELPAKFFDVITFNDVLEHMIEPAHALTAAANLLSEGGVVVASIPNVRHRSVVWPLVWHGSWQYEEVGILDKTHLRFFTKQSMRQMFTESGWRIQSIVGINPCWHMLDGSSRRRSRLVKYIAPRALGEILFLQYVVTASPCRGKKIAAQ